MDALLGGKETINDGSIKLGYGHDVYNFYYENTYKGVYIMGIDGRKWASHPTKSYVKFRKWLDKILKREY